MAREKNIFITLCIGHNATIFYRVFGLFLFHQISIVRPRAPVCLQMRVEIAMPCCRGNNAMQGQRNNIDAGRNENEVVKYSTLSLKRAWKLNLIGSDWNHLRRCTPGHYAVWHEFYLILNSVENFSSPNPRTHSRAESKEFLRQT